MTREKQIAAIASARIKIAKILGRNNPRPTDAPIAAATDEILVSFEPQIASRKDWSRTSTNDELRQQIDAAIERIDVTRGATNADWGLLDAERKVQEERLAALDDDAQPELRSQLP
jgi:hypothetical protein